MTNSEPRSIFELSHKLRPRDADRFEKTCPVSKNRAISPKNGVSANTSLVGSQSQSRSDLHGPICGSLSWRPPLSIAIPSVSISISSERKRAINDYRHRRRHLLQTMSLIISCIVFALIITINISCTGGRRQIAHAFAMPLPRIGVVELTNAPDPKHVPFTGTSALTNIAVTPAVQPAIGY